MTISPQDIAVLSDNVSLCESFYQKESFNVAPKQICKERYPTGEVKGHSDFNNQADCEADNAGTCVCLYHVHQRHYFVRPQCTYSFRHDNLYL